VNGWHKVARFSALFDRPEIDSCINTQQRNNNKEQTERNNNKEQQGTTRNNREKQTERNNNKE
jgi:hypothetical protein